MVQTLQPRSDNWPLHGVMPVLVTPFGDDGKIDTDSMARQVEHQVTWGVDGVVLFGLASEVHKLTDRERTDLTRAVVDAAAGRVPVILGCEHNGVDGAAERAAESQELGADALMAFPPSFMPPPPSAVRDYYLAIARASGLPLIAQDAPGWTGVSLTVDFLSDLAGLLDTPFAVKVEAPPTGPKIAALQERGVPSIGGYGALHVAEERIAGAVGTMPGSGLPGLLRDVWGQLSTHPPNEEVYTAALPLLAFQMGSLNMFIAVQKTLLARIGVIRDPKVREPTTFLTDSQLRRLDYLLQSTGAAEYAQPQP